MSRPGAGAPAYGRVARLLHWTVFLALLVQFLVGYAMDRGGPLEELAEGWLGEDEQLLAVHAALGVAILVLATVRVVWRRTVGLVLKHQLVDRDGLLRRML